MSGRYGLIRLRIVFDDNREDLVVFQVYDPSTNKWVEVSKEVFEDIIDRAVDRPVAGGFTPSGIHTVAAVPRLRLGPYARYVVEWVDKLPKRPIMINEGVKVIYRGRKGDTEYYEVKPL